MDAITAFDFLETAVYLSIAGVVIGFGSLLFLFIFWLILKRIGIDLIEMATRYTTFKQDTEIRQIQIDQFSNLLARFKLPKKTRELPLPPPLPPTQEVIVRGDAGANNRRGTQW